jgi:YVTN family beta-propeller protein
MKPGIRRLWVGALLPTALLACGDGGNGPGATLTFSPASLALADCAVGTISAYVRDADGNPVSRTVTFTSDDPHVASVNASGTVTGEGPGATSISIVSGSLSGSIAVGVTAGPETLSAPAAVIVNRLQTSPLGGAMVDCHGDPTGTAITYNSADDNVATISPSGLVSGVNLGTTNITLLSGAQQKVVTVDVVGSPSRSSVANVPLNNVPLGVAISRLGAVYVAQHASETVGRSDIPVTSFSSSVTVGTAPADVVFNPSGTTAYVSNEDSNSVSVINVANNSEQLQIPLGFQALTSVVSPDGATIYATVVVGKVYVINAATNIVVDSFNVGTYPNGLAFSPGGTRLYISSRDAGWVIVYDTLTNRTIDTLVTGGIPQRLAVSRDGAELYVGDEALGLDIWSLTSGSRIVSLPVGGHGGFGVALSPDDMIIYVSSPSGGEVAVVDRATHAGVGTIATGGKPRNIAFDRFGAEALITNEAGFVTVVR